MQMCWGVKKYFRIFMITHPASSNSSDKKYQEHGQFPNNCGWCETWLGFISRLMMRLAPPTPTPGQDSQDQVIFPITRLELSLYSRETMRHENHEQTKCSLKTNIFKPMCKDQVTVKRTSSWQNHEMFNEHFLAKSYHHYSELASKSRHSIKSK